MLAQDAAIAAELQALTVCQKGLEALQKEAATLTTCVVVYSVVCCFGGSMDCVVIQVQTGWSSICMQYR